MSTNDGNPRGESFQEWIDQGIVEATIPDMWQPAWRDQKGHRISVSDAYKPIPTLKLNWRWWLAEIPNRILARWAIRQTSLCDQAGEVYTGGGSHFGATIHQQLDQYNRELGPE